MIEEVTLSEALFQDEDGPIELLKWGCFTVRGATHGQGDDGRLGKGKDIRIVGDKVTRWKEREGHRLRRSMITGVYDEEIDVLVIGAGVQGGIEVPEKVRVDVASHGIEELIVEPTPEACCIFNTLYREGKRVALLAHGTC